MNDVSQQPESCISFGTDGDVTVGAEYVVTDSDSVTQAASDSSRSAVVLGPGNGIK